MLPSSLFFEQEQLVIHTKGAKLQVQSMAIYQFKYSNSDQYDKKI